MTVSLLIDDEIHLAVSTRSFVLFGSFSHFTYFVLKKMLAHGMPVDSVIIHAYGPGTEPSGRLSVQVDRMPVVGLCKRSRIPIFYATGPKSKLLEFLSAQKADYFVLACYPRLLSEEVVALARLACINIHPSKLPAYRGPDPIFWQLKQGETDTGISLHQVSNQLDSGDVYSVLSLPYKSGARFQNILEDLLKIAIDELSRLVELSADLGSTTKQNEQLATWFQSPCDNDYSFTTDSNAYTVFNFVRAYAMSNATLTIKGSDFCLDVRDALGYSKQSISGYVIHNADNSATVQFSDGSVSFLLESDKSSP